MTGEDFWVHCGKCGYGRVLCQAPVPVDVFSAVSKLPCASCRSKDIRIGKRPRETADGEAHQWLENGDTGVSSKTIWSVMMGSGQDRLGSDVPHDPDDFGRCYRLLKVMPAWRARLGEVAAKHPAWRGLVDSWDELTALYEEELPKKSAPKLYARMRQLIGEARVQAK